MTVTSDSGKGSTRQLLELSAGYFVSYVATGMLVKYFTAIRQPPMSELAYLVNNTAGSSILAVTTVLVLGWYRLQSNGPVTMAGLRMPGEYRYIIPSGVCTAVIIPTTTLMYLLPISVMVAMVLMRGSVIIISRAVDAIQIRQGILKKTVFAEENWAVLFAILAVTTNVFFIPIVNALEARGIPAAASLGVSNRDRLGAFDFLSSGPALLIMGSYIVAYAIRIYIMNYYKNTRAAGVKQDNKGFFAVEQIAASLTLLLAGILLFFSQGLFGAGGAIALEFRSAVTHPRWDAVLSGIPWGIVAFFSVFLFMFEGRTATFAGLVNRLVSLVAGTTATLALALFFGQRPPKVQDWVAFAFILVAVGFLSRAEKKRGA
ncbi:MAG: hypothetical protein SGI90_03300 [Candidatus Eisenbacteria bacterium]|nr:hypothetical protein [Candidatus Eisenbacteria bacterium]